MKDDGDCGTNSPSSSGISAEDRPLPQTGRLCLRDVGQGDTGVWGLTRQCCAAGWTLDLSGGHLRMKL